MKCLNCGYEIDPHSTHAADFCSEECEKEYLEEDEEEEEEEEDDE